MPHINRIRVNNVRYNFGTQFYDDFIMRFDGKNVLYDLANGGGKSVLLLLLLQNLIPNCTLDDKQPVEKLFRGSNGSTVIHSLIEWKLDDYLIRDDYRYMLTGFCARKAREDEGQNASREVASIEYFNYVIFYRHYNDNDIINLPLSNGKERITFPGLKTYLKNLPKQDYQLQVYVFERKGEYQHFISRYGLYESEWEIIRGINKTEGHVRAYFENHYRTTRKVVEDLLIEEIIRKAFVMRTSGGEEGSEGADTALMADTLYRIRDQLVELTRRKDELHHYDQQQEVLQSLGERIRTLDNMYGDEADLQYDMAKTWQTALLSSKVRSRDLAVAEKEREKAEEQLRELDRKLETARVQSGKARLSDLEEAADECRKALNVLQNEQAGLRDNLNLRESMNDYLDYLEDKLKYQKTSEAVSHAMGDQEELAVLLRRYADAWRIRYRAQLHGLDGRGLAGRQQIRLNEAMLKEHQEREREADRLLAVLEHDQEQNRSNEKEYLRRFAGLRERAGLLVIETVDKELRDCRKQQEAAALQLENTKQQQMGVHERIQTLSLRMEQIGPKLFGVRQEIERLSAFMKEWKANNERLRKLLDIYHVKDMSGLRQQIADRYRRMIYEMEVKRQQQLQLEKRLKELKEGNPLPAEDDVRQLMEYIRTCHGITCIYGAQYVKGLSAAERAVLLQRLPMLPYAVILKDGFARVAEDILLKEKDFGNHVIPVMGLETVLSENMPVDGEHILFAGKGCSYYLDERLIEKECQRCVEEADTLKRQLTRMQDQLETYEKDMEDMSGFLLVYDSQKDSRSQALTEARKLEQQLMKEQTDSTAAYHQLTAEDETLAGQIKEQEKALAAADERCEILLELKTVYEALDAVRKCIADCTQKQSSASREKQAQQDAIGELEAANRELAEQCQAASRQKEQLLREWQEGWQLYAGENGEDGDTHTADTEVSAMSDDELKAAFAGVRDAYEKEHLDLTDKKQLMDSYSRSMERLMKSITDRNLTSAQLEEMRRDGRLYRTWETQIQDMRTELREKEGETGKLYERLTAMEAEVNRLCGSVTQAASVLEERYGAYKEVKLNDQSYEMYIQNMSRLVAETREKLDMISRRIERLTRDNYAMEGLRRDLERMLKLYHVPADLTKDTYNGDVNLKRKYEELIQRHEQMQMQHFSRKEAFEKDKAKAVSSLRLLGAEGLAAEIESHMVLPEDAQAARQVLDGIAETIQLIELERGRVEKNMSDLLVIKETFENQCLQVCQNIRMELDKLSKMSVITMDGEQIQMIGLTIPYIKETFYRQQMSAYIDEIVDGVDSYGTQEERLHYIRQQLAWKRLFAVIVTDMNAIRLMLYKRERIREQSRYLKYEEAVGSTGQSQGIYIQFLIAIIHYISCIYAGAASKDALKKVIFIDNPFGAAKDIYIWEPIFALLKTNNVQLIVPARGATPAITGRFDVNYVLGQRMINDRQQTIVVDYHSNIVIEEMEYVKIDFEQEVFDFV